MLKECAAALAVVFGAHALAYFLLNILPDAAAIALGMEAAKADVVSAFHASNPPRTYWQAVSGLVLLDYGNTLDSVPVSDEIARSLGQSAPRILLAFALVCATGIVVSFLRWLPRRLFSFLSFLPPYVSAFFALLILLMLGLATPGGSALDWACIVAIAISPAALVAEQAAAVTQRNLATEYARALRAVGANEFYLRRSLVPNLAAELSPSLEKVWVLLAGSLLFAEPILGLPGLGTTAIRAVRRADPDLVLGITVVLALSVVLARIAAVAVRRQFGLRA